MEYKPFINYESRIEQFKKGMEIGPQQFDVYWCDLPIDFRKPSQLGKRRPVIIISNNMHNKGANTVQIIPMTTSYKKEIPCHVKLNNIVGDGLVGTAMIEEFMTIPKEWLVNYIGTIGWREQRKIKEGMLIQLGFM